MDIKIEAAETNNAETATGFIFYEGASMIDGSPIVAIATMESENGKTGNMIQTWIIRSDVNPIEASHTGKDKSNCGNCGLKGKLVTLPDGTTKNVERACYVNLGQAPLGVYWKFVSGGYPVLGRSDAARFAGRSLRRGSYGDPVAVPYVAWSLLERLCTGEKKTGYTHQWRLAIARKFRGRLMASVHNDAEAAEAVRKGWRYFLTVTDLDDIGDEILCPASKEAGNRRQCITCGACNGSKGKHDLRKNVAIVGHGPKAKRIALAMVS